MKRRAILIIIGLIALVALVVLFTFLPEKKNCPVCGEVWYQSRLDHTRHRCLPAEVRGFLEKLRLHEAAYFEKHGIYTADIEELFRQKWEIEYVKSRGLNITIHVSESRYFGIAELKESKHLFFFADGVVAQPIKPSWIYKTTAE